MNRINLHIHSIASDGILSGVEIVEKASEEKLKYISITDHDSIGEVQNAINYSKSKNIIVIPGVELTADYPNGQCHILGYGISLETIEKFSKRIRESRIKKAKKIIEMLVNGGYEITYNEVLEVCLNGVIGRRDIAKILSKHGYFDSEDEAIKLLLSPGGKFYIETQKNKIEDCISIIKESGGISVIAHPWTLNLTLAELREFLILYQFEGIEVYNHNISEKIYEQLNELAIELNLYKTCGTDYHGQKGLNDFIVNKNVDCTRILRKISGDKNE